MATLADELYRQDFYAWTREQADALRRLAGERWNGPLDLENLAEEIEDLGTNVLEIVLTRLRRIIEHLLKLEYSPSPLPRRQWLVTVRSARADVRRRMTARIRNTVEEEFDEIFADARYNAAQSLAAFGELESARALPPTCPYGLDQLLDRDWLPTTRHGLVDEPL